MRAIPGQAGSAAPHHPSEPPNASRRCPGSPPLRPRRAHHVSPGSEGRGHAPWRAAARWRGLALPPHPAKGVATKPAHPRQHASCGRWEPTTPPHVLRKGVARPRVSSGRGQRSSRAGLPPHPPTLPLTTWLSRPPPRPSFVRCEGKRGEGGVGRSRGVVTPAPFPFLWTQEVPETGEGGGEGKPPATSSLPPRPFARKRKLVSASLETLRHLARRTGGGRTEERDYF